MRKDNFFNRYYFIALGLSTYPVTLLFTSNHASTNLLMYLIPLLVVYFFVTCIYFIFYTLRSKLAFKNIHLSSSIVSIFFFIYGIYYSFLISSDTFLSMLGSHRFLLPLTIILLILIIYLINRINKPSSGYQFVLILLMSLNILPFLNIVDNLFLKEIKNTSEPSLVKNNSIASSPNIYYIILDGYGSVSSIKKYLEYDNSSFTKQLEEIGFKVQKNATSNYCRTIFSLTSTLNFNYIQDFIKPKVTQENLNKYLSENRVSEILKLYGYNYYIFDSGFGLKKNYGKNEFLIKSIGLNFLHNAFSTSDNDILNSFINNSLFRISENPFFANLAVKNYASKVLSVFSKLPTLAKNSDKKFVFAHIISPHPPFLFDRFGKVGKYGDYDPSSGNFNWNQKLYVEQMSFINTKIINTLREIIKNDKRDKIIVIQGDHGTRVLPETRKLKSDEGWVQEEYSILNAIYISKNDSTKKYIYNNWNYSSVNTFRILFNGFYEYNFPILIDNKYYSELKEPYSFIKIEP